MKTGPQARSSQRGLGLVGAIFFITVVALLTVALTRSVATTAQAGALDIQRMHALLAAESGAQLGSHAALPPSGAAQCTGATINLTEFGLPGCQAVVSCRFTTVDTIRYYTIQSDGQCSDGGRVAAQRSVLVRLVGG